MYKPIQIDREKLTIMGVPLPDLETLNSVAYAIGSNMYEGFEPNEKLIQLYINAKNSRIDNFELITQMKAAL